MIFVKQKELGAGVAIHMTFPWWTRMLIRLESMSGHFEVEASEARNPAA
jgi:hypothetical protein